MNLKMNPELLSRLCCPVCRGDLKNVNGNLFCVCLSCNIQYPIVDGIPVLINDKNSIFSISDFILHKDTTFKRDQSQSSLKRISRNLRPKLTINIKSKENYGKLADTLLQISDHPVVLIIGGSILGKGMEYLIDQPHIELVDTDVSFGPRTQLICDSHNIPFKDGTFDGVIAQAVLEHVADPNQCVEEIYRVLIKGGLVYAETPFMQQVHMREYDFTRFTHLGHRRLFRKFVEIESGAALGTGSALAQSYQNFLFSFAKSKLIRRFLTYFGEMTSFWIKYFDYLTIDSPGTLDAASGYYFLGSKTDQIISDKELIKYYRGAQ